MGLRALKVHVFSKHRSKDYSNCDACEKTFKSKGNLRQHFKVHETKPPNKSTSKPAGQLARREQSKIINYQPSNSKVVGRNVSLAIPDQIAKIFQNLIEDLTNNENSFEAKMYCVCALHSMILRNSRTAKYITKVEVITELANLVNEIVSKVGEEKNEDLVLIAKILAKIDGSVEGKNLIANMKMSFSAFQRLNSEMKRFDF